MPVFVANGDGDPMILPRYSYLLAGLLPDARVKIYPDSAHGFLFQHHGEFAADVNAFLGEASRRGPGARRRSETFRPESSGTAPYPAHVRRGASPPELPAGPEH
jgi:hypothetical protein